MMRSSLYIALILLAVVVAAKRSNEYTESEAEAAAAAGARTMEELKEEIKRSETFYHNEVMRRIAQQGQQQLKNAQDPREQSKKVFKLAIFVVVTLVLTFVMVLRPDQRRRHQRED